MYACCDATEYKIARHNHNTIVIFLLCFSGIGRLRQADVFSDHGGVDLKTSNFQRKTDLQAFIVPRMINQA